MKPKKKALIYAAVSIGVFVSAVFLEAWIRQTQIAEMTIAGLPIEGTQVSGFYMPDLFWAGHSWWIEIETEKPLRLSLDGWSGRIPAGAHKVFSNHDHTNTGDYGGRDFWGFPKSVSIQELTHEPRNTPDGHH